MTLTPTEQISTNALYREYVFNMQKTLPNHITADPYPACNQKSQNSGLPYPDSAAFSIRKAAQTHQISFKTDSRNVRHAEKFYTAGVIRVQVFWQSTGPIIGIREPTPIHCKINKPF